MREVIGELVGYLLDHVVGYCLLNRGGKVMAGERKSGWGIVNWGSEERRK